MLSLLLLPQGHSGIFHQPSEILFNIPDPVDQNQQYSGYCDPLSIEQSFDLPVKMEERRSFPYYIAGYPERRNQHYDHNKEA
jgi:hypothetical protein